MKPMVKTVEIAPTILKSVEPGEIIIDRNLSSDVDQHNDIIQVPYDLEALRLLRFSSIWHRKCIKAVAVDVTKRGWVPEGQTETPSEENQSRLENVFNDYDNNEALFRMMEDYRTFTHATLELLENTKGEFRGFKHIRAITIRMCKGGEKAVQKVGSRTAYYKIADKRPEEDLDYKTGQWGVAGQDFPIERKATEIIWLNSSGMDSDYYHEPEYLASIPTIMSEEFIREYNNNGFITNGVPNYLITFTGDFDEGDIDEDTGKSDFETALETAIGELQNQPGNAIVLTMPTNSAEGRIEVNIQKVSNEIKEASFEKFRESNRDEILGAHEVPASRLGVTITGPLAGSIAEEENKVYNENVVIPLQVMLDNILNKIVVQQKMEIEDFKHKYKPLDTRNVTAELEIATTLEDKAAMTPLQLLQAFSDTFKLEVDVEQLKIDHPELDEYYLNGQPIKVTTGPVEDVLRGMENRITAMNQV